MIKGYLHANNILAAATAEDKLAAATAEDNFNKTMKNFITSFQLIVLAIFAICLIIFVGLPLITGGDEGKQKAKKNAPAMVIGLIITVGAVTIAEAIKSKIAFTK